MSSKKYTTFDISKICGVAVSTISEWTESGKIKAYKTLGGHRRIAEEDLIDFLKKNNFPIPDNLSVETTRKVLIVDDDESILNYIKQILEISDVKYITDCATNGFDAGDKLNTFKPDVVILDVMIPNMDGYEVCKLIKNRHPDVKVIAISGKNVQEVKDKMLAAGSDVFIPKPFEAHSILNELEKN